MRMGFLIDRMTYFKTLGNLIEICLEAGHEVWLFHLAEADWGSKDYQKVVIEDFPRFAHGQPNLAPYRMDEVSGLGKQFKLDALVTHEGYRMLSIAGEEDELRRLRESGTRTFALSHFYEFSKQPLEALDHFDCTFFMSEFGRDLMLNLQAGNNGRAEDLRQRYLARTAVVSTPAFEQIGITTPATARAEFGIPHGKPVVLFVAPVLSGVTSWRWVAWREPDRRTRIKRAISARRWRYLPETLTGPSFKECVDAVRAFCDRNGATLVVKSREKQDDPDYLVAAADVYLDGSAEIYYPVFTTYRLLAAADLLITANSMSVIEAVAAGIPAINIYVPHLEFNRELAPVHRAYLDTLLGGKPDSLMNFSGCIWAVDRRAFPRWMDRRRWEDLKVDESRRAKYVDRFLGITDEPSSRRILREMEKAVAHG
ncbi:MAG: hypothetical protein EPO32_08070 [Anaerolineae bacterium]|nr:MAG: hypothetical protein EPO32_08070 [Anaerolineae bacterium]